MLKNRENLSLWTAVCDGLPTTPGTESPRLIVACREFGQPWAYAIARCWISTDAPLLPKFYLDPGFYGMPTLVQIAEVVHFWMLFPELTSE